MAIFGGSSLRRRLAVTTFGIALCAAAAVFYFRPVVHAQDNLTPGMLFGPLSIEFGQHVELCSSYLGPESGLTVSVHFRNLTTGEVTAIQDVAIKSGGGGCVSYAGKGRVIGMTRGSGPAADWVSPSNALIGTMTLVTESNNAQAAVLGVPKMWVKGL